MDDKDEVHSDSGSFELIDFHDYVSDPENLNMEADASGNLDQSDDGSYVFVRSREGIDSTTDSSDEKTEPSQSEGEEEVEEEEEEEEEEDESSDMEFNDNFDVRKNRNFTYFDRLPDNIKLKEEMEIKDVVKDHVLRYLPAKSLARSRLVSKEWDKWISSPFLAHLQCQYFNETSGFFEDDNGVISFISLDKSAYGVPNPSLSFLPMKVSIRSSCHGLILCEARDEENEYYVCNPVKKEWVKLPDSSYYHGPEPKIVIVFEPSSLDFDPCYKLVCAFPIPDIGPAPVCFDIYDSKTKSWRISDVICADLDECSLKNDGIFVNGVVYWGTTGGEMLAFDPENEIYGIQTLPREKHKNGAISKVHGELSYVESHYDGQIKKFVVDVYGGTLMSSNNTLSLDVSFEDGGEPVECAVLGSSRDDVLAFVAKKFDGTRFLYVYHVKDEKFEARKVLVSSNSSKLFPYINSLGSVVAK